MTRHEAAGRLFAFMDDGLPAPAGPFPPSPGERSAVAAHVAAVLRAVLRARGTPDAEGRAAELAGRFESHVCATCATRQDYLRAVRERVANVRATAGHSANNAAGTFAHSATHTSPANIAAAHTAATERTEEHTADSAAQSGPVIVEEKADDAAPLRAPQTSGPTDDAAIVASKLARLQAYLPHVEALLAHPRLRAAGTLPPEPAEAHGRLVALRAVVLRQAALLPAGKLILSLTAATNIVDQVRHYAGALQAYIRTLPPVEARRPSVEASLPASSLSCSTGDVSVPQALSERSGAAHARRASADSMRPKEEGASARALETAASTPTLPRGASAGAVRPEFKRPSVDEKFSASRMGAQNRVVAAPTTQRLESRVLIDADSLEENDNVRPPKRRRAFLVPAEVLPVIPHDDSCAAFPPVLRREMDAWSRIAVVGAHADAPSALSFSYEMRRGVACVEVACAALPGGALGVEFPGTYPARAVALVGAAARAVRAGPPLVAPVSLTAVLLRLLAPATCII